MVAQEVEIVPYQRKDKEFVDSILESIWGMEPPDYPYGEEDFPANGRSLPSTYIAKVTGQPVGFCSIWRNEYHPSALYFSIHIHENFRNKGIGTMLLDHIKEINNDKLSLQTSFWETSIVGDHFLRSKGFKVIRKTIEPVLDLLHIENILASMRSCDLPEEYQILNLSEIEDEVEYMNFITLTKKCYQYTHLDNPLGEISLEEWRRVVESDTVPDGSFVVMKNNVIIAFALLHENSNKIKDLGWRGVDSSCENNTKELILALTYKQLEYAHKQQQDYLNAEIDTTDKWSLIMLDHLPFANAPTWVTYQLRSANSAK